MTDLQNRMKKLTWINLGLLVIMLLYCFRNWQLDIEGICQECAVDTVMYLIFGLFFMCIQIVAGIFMCCLVAKLKKKWQFILILILAVINIFLALMQIVFFSQPMRFANCGEIPGAAVIEIKKIEVQFVVARILSVGLILLNMFLIRFYGQSLVQRKNVSITN